MHLTEIDLALSVDGEHRVRTTLPPHVLATFKMLPIHVAGMPGETQVSHSLNTHTAGSNWRTDTALPSVNGCVSDILINDTPTILANAKRSHNVAENACPYE
jgi:hypothetical protein